MVSKFIDICTANKFEEVDISNNLILLKQPFFLANLDYLNSLVEKRLCYVEELAETTVGVTYKNKHFPVYVFLDTDACKLIISDYNIRHYSIDLPSNIIGYIVKRRLLNG